jgi:transmembrane sensor
MPEDIPTDLFIRSFSGNVTPDEQKRLDMWLGEDPQRAREMEDLKKIWQLSHKMNAPVNLDTAWYSVSEKVKLSGQPDAASNPVRYGAYVPGSRSSRHSGLREFIRVAAAIVFLLGLGYIFLSDRSTPEITDEPQAMREVTTEKGQQAQLRFSDGTKVTLNYTSSLRFPERFSNEFREVYLTGEAFFEVTPGKKPFIVYTTDAVVKVLGTSFNVTAWPNDEWVDVVVTEGSVSVSSDYSSDSEWLVLHERYRSRVVRGVGPMQPERIDSQKYLRWLAGETIFENTPLDAVIKQLERQYDVSFVVKDDDLFSRRLTATLKNETIKDILTLFSLTLNVHCELMDSVVVITALDE